MVKQTWLTFGPQALHFWKLAPDVVEKTAFPMTVFDAVFRITKFTCVINNYVGMCKGIIRELRAIKCTLHEPLLVARQTV